MNSINRTEWKNLYIYSSAKTISLFGTSIYQFALGLYVLKLTGSALSFAVTLILGIIPMVLINPFAGVIADKWNKKRLVVSMDLLNGLLLVAVFWFSSIVGLNLITIYVTTFLLTVFTTFFGVGMEAAKPNMVSEQKLMSINSISKIIDSVSSIMGPMIGGIVFALFDIRTFIIFNGISFILSGLSLMLINFKLFQVGEQATEKVQFIKDIKEGFQYLKEKKNLINLFILLISLNFFMGFAVMVPLPYILNTVLGLSPKEFGIIEGALPVGIILGALMVKKLTNKISYGIFLKYLSITLAVCMILIGFPVLLESYLLHPVFYVIYYCIVMLLIGAVIALIDVPLAYFMQKEIPDEFRGRVLSIGISIAKTMLPLAMITAGLLLNHVSAFIIPIAGGIMFLLFTMRSTPKVRVEIVINSRA
ncbi:MFS transporter [Neobacillus sp. LXY-1]|uniref:MFS transporter n=1 Tax=Neobacillus sp. LXY-1 TaxID=3379133 RepID=UPI003EE1B407